MTVPQPQWVTPENVGLLTDLYQLTMADSYLSQGLNQRATYNLFVRKLPTNRHFLVSAGLESILDYLENLRFTSEGIEYLGSLKLFSEAFLEYLRNFKFTGDVYAIAESEIVFPPEPLIEVRAPRIEAQIIETFLLNQINFQTLIASKAARVVLAAGDRNVVDFSPRRDHGMDAALKAARSSYIAGCVGTSNMLAGQLYGIPVYGTMAHAYIMSFDKELDAFRAYAHDFPDNSTLLVDTYDTIGGVHNAIRVAEEMRDRGEALQAVRLDSGDFLELSKSARALLDARGFSEVKIFVSGDMNEYKISELLQAGAPIDAFGVGTELGTSHDAPALGGVYKLVQDQNGPQMKLSTGKVTLPGQKQIWRCFDLNGLLSQDVIALADEEAPDTGAEPLLNLVMKEGRRVQQPEPLDALRKHCLNRYTQLPGECRAITADESAVTCYDVRESPRLKSVRVKLTKRLEQQVEQAKER